VLVQVQARARVQAPVPEPVQVPVQVPVLESAQAQAQVRAPVLAIPPVRAQGFHCSCPSRRHRRPARQQPSMRQCGKAVGGRIESWR